MTLVELTLFFLLAGQQRIIVGTALTQQGCMKMAERLAKEAEEDGIPVPFLQCKIGEPDERLQPLMLGLGQKV